MKPFVRFAVALGALALVAPPAVAAPEQGQEKVNQLIVFGRDPCPPSTDEQITVCARKDENERFRIPEPLRADPNSPKNEAWTERVKAYETVGATGTNSCSPVGAGGATGCLTRLIDSAYTERKQASDVQFGKLIEAERAKRLGTIDTDASAEQARVESLEKEYDAKLARERTAGDAPVATPSPDGTPPAHQ